MTIQRRAGLPPRTRLNSRGVTITELMVAVALLSIGVLGMIGAFGGIQKALQTSRNATLASSLGQEKMQILRQQSYYQVLITTNPAYNTDYSPSIPYDPGYFTPETIKEGGIYYQRTVYVQVARENSGTIVVLPPTTPDTGLKLITVDVLWTEAGRKKFSEINSVLANPDTVMTNSIFTGTVRDAVTAAAIPYALVSAAENLGFQDTTNASGGYTVNLSPGNFTLGVTVPGYFPSHRSVSVAANQTSTQDFDLQPMSSGTVVGRAWFNPNLVVSQVVVSTVQADTGYEAQYIELYNPTSSTVTIVSGGVPQIKLKMASGCSGASYVTCNGSTGIHLNYVNTEVGPGNYYLVANTGTFVVNGRVMTADAVYADDIPTYCSNPPSASWWNLSVPRRKLLPDGHGATVMVTDASDVILDAVGVSHAGVTSPNCEGTCFAEPSGFAVGAQWVRISSPTWTGADLAAYGRAYDSDNNSVDVASASAIVYDPYESTDPAKPVATGKVAVGAAVTATDGLSPGARAVATGSPPVATFSLTNVATGTWTVLVTSRTYTLENDTVTIAATGSLYVFPATMSWLTNASSDTFITGTVTDVLGNPLAVPVPVDSGGVGPTGSANTTNGRYLLRISTVGFVDVTANSGVGSVSNYVSVSSLSVPTSLGQVTSGVNFTLVQGGRAMGFATRDGVNALPGVSFVALDVNGYSHDQQVTGSSGRFTTNNISTGTYTIEPVLDVLETSSPSSATVTIAGGVTTWTSTFTISGALGTIQGSVTLGGQTLRTGTLIVVTTATLAGSPPAPPSLSTASLVSAPYYLASTHEDGTYSVDVRQSTSPAYHVYAYYTSYSGSTPQINALTQTNVQVLSGQTVTGVDFAW